MPGNQKISQYLDASPLIVLALDLHGRVTFINRTGCRLLELQSDAVVGHDWVDTFLPKEHSSTPRHIIRQLSAGHFESATYWENTILTKSGERRLIAWHNTVLRDKSGRAVEILSFGNDITERRQQLEESEARFKALFDANICAITVVDPKTQQIIMANYRMIEMTGYTLKELTAMCVCDLHPREIKAQITSFISGLQHDTKQTLPEIPVFCKTGNIVFCDIAGCTVMMDGRDCAVGFMIDVTERKLSGDATRQALETIRQAREAADSASRAKSQFLATMSHELRTPLSPIIGFADILLNSNLSDEQKDMISHIRKRGQYLLNCINQILELSKIEADRIELFPVPCRPRAMLAELLARHRSKAEARGLRLFGKVDDDVPEQLVFDVARVKQAIDSLIENAIAFTAEGEVEFRVRLAGNEQNTSFQPGVILRCEVRDTGIGMPADKLQTIFEPFTQLDSSLARAHGGMGLSLTLARRFAKLMSGNIEVASEPGRGSVFTLVFPAGIDIEQP